MSLLLVRHGQASAGTDDYDRLSERGTEQCQRLAARSQGNVLVLTSGGVISRLAQAALGASDRSAVDLNLSLRNSGLCEFHARPYGLALGSWNALPHLHDCARFLGEQRGERIVARRAEVDVHAATRCERHFG
jgi:broad specificity phosphatase PhoE